MYYDMSTFFGAYKKKWSTFFGGKSAPPVDKPSEVSLFDEPSEQICMCQSRTVCLVTKLSLVVNLKSGLT